MGRNKFAVARRSIWYFLRILLEVVLLITLVLGVFTTGLYTSNIYIILQDGMEKRADCILHASESSELTEYFTDTYLLHDEALQKKAYEPFTVSNYDYRLEVERLLAFPWESRVQVPVLERLASLSAVPDEQGENSLPPALPDWPSARLSVTLVRREGLWLIDGIEVLETNPPEKPLPTPDMRLLSEGSAAP